MAGRRSTSPDNSETFGFSNDEGLHRVAAANRVNAESIPDQHELEDMFNVLLSGMSISDSDRAEMMFQSNEKKWNLILNDRNRRLGLPAEYFATQLARHNDPELRSKKIQKKFLAGLDPSVNVLEKLEVSLRTCTPVWMEEFLDHPNNGHLLLEEFMDDLPDAAARKSLNPLLQRQPGELHLVVMCIKAIMDNDYGFRKILNEEHLLNKVAARLCSDVGKTRLAAMQILAKAATDPHDGGIAVMDAIHYLSSTANEPTRFYTICQLLQASDTPKHFKIAAVQLMLDVMKYSPDLNMLVYWQMDLERAGMNEIINNLASDEDSEVAALAALYLPKLVSVDQIVELRDEGKKLQSEASAEIEVLQETVTALTKDRDVLRGQYKEASVKSNDLTNMIESYRKEVDRLNNKLEEASKIMIEQNEMMTEHRQQLELLETEHLMLRETTKQMQLTQQQIGIPLPTTTQPVVPPPPPPTTGSGVSTESALAPPPPPPPLAPPPPPPLGLPPPPPPIGGLMGIPMAPPVGGLLGGFAIKPRITPKVPLPMVNWVPLRKVTGTIFEFLTDEQVLLELDFTAFEAMFKQKDSKVLGALAFQAKKKEEKIVVVEQNRARNLVIAVRRIGMEHEFLKQTILQTDLTELAPEYTELLLNYIASEDEVAALEKHSHHKARLDEAERFMYEMLAVDRYESRLRVMSYIGTFDETLLNSQPQVDALLMASKNLTNCPAFEKLLEIILAFGNYMNSHKRGSAYGFKLETFERLLLTRSAQSRDITLLHFIQETVENEYPHVEAFWEKLAGVEKASRISIVSLQADVKALRNGIDLILYEREKQKENFIIYSFYLNAVQKVGKLNEDFKEMKEQYQKAATLFNEDPNQIEPFEFFGAINVFIKNWKKCKADNKKRREAPTKVKKTFKVLTSDEFANKFSDLKVDLAPHPLLGTSSKVIGGN